MNRLRLIVLKIAAALALQAAAADLLAQQTQHLPTVPLNVGVYLIHAEVAATPAQREQGLMFRDKLGANDGMVFLFEAPSQVCMWMKNTLIPLSIGYFNNQKKLIDIQDMEPVSLVERSPKVYPSKSQAKYALEVPKGWFTRNRISIGAPLELPRH